MPLPKRRKEQKPSKHQIPLFASLFLGSLGLSLVPDTLLTGTLVPRVASGNAQLRVSTTLNRFGHLALLDLLEGDVGGGNGEGGGDGGDLAQLGDVGLGVTLLGGVGLAGQQDQALLVGLETSDVGGEALLAEVLAAVINGDTDGGSQGSGNASLLWLIVRKKNSDVSCQRTPVPLFVCFFFQSENRPDFVSDRFIRVHTFSSMSVKPRPVRTLRLYLMVGHRTIGRSLSTGRGARAAALA